MESKKYWKSIDELNRTSEFLSESSKEFGQQVPVDEVVNNTFDLSSSRRDFLKISGFSLAAASLAACNTTPMRRAIPLLNQPEEISPGLPNYYASTYYDGNDYCSVLVKTREGRPIKIEGNNLSRVTSGGTNARVQASVLSLYDQERFKDPLVKGVKTSWETIDSTLLSKLAALSAAGKNIRLVTTSVISPSAKQAIAKFLAKYPTAKHVVYDAISTSGVLEANMADFGLAALPTYRFDKAKMIVGIGCDFLGTWVNSIENTKRYAKGRKLSASNPKMSRHIQFEANVSLTGANADKRVAYNASQEAMVVANLYNAIAALSGGSAINAGKTSADTAIKKAAKELVAAKGAAIVVCGSNNKNVQKLVNAINNMLGNYGNTIEMSNPVFLKQGIDSEIHNVVSEMQNGQVAALIMVDTNLAYDFAKAKEFAEGLKKVELTVAIDELISETNAQCEYIMAAHNWLESWGDAQPKKSSMSLIQPAIAPLFNTRQWEESILVLAGAGESYYSFVKANWKNSGFDKGGLFDAFWRQSLHNGVMELGGSEAATYSGSVAGLSLPQGNADKIDLVIYEKLGIGNGKFSNNPWLQELPDPISKATWDNYLAISPNYGIKNNIKEGDVVEVSANGYSVTVPVLMQPGLTTNTVALALGYGRTMAGRVAGKLVQGASELYESVGVNANPFVSVIDGTRNYVAENVTIKPTGDNSPIAQTQTHHTIEGRAIVKESTLGEYVKNRNAGNEREGLLVRDENNDFVRIDPTEITLWEERTYKGHHWKMSVDLSSCIGCGACTIACQVENNIPVVGKKEVLNRREMHWIRIDRYYRFKDKSEEADSDEFAITEETQYGGETYNDTKTAFTFRYSDNRVEDFSEVEVAFMPVMCQQCDNAPCETVCPVLATVHSDEGLNQMAYNRCVGTRYCANNCPYKVRRFNWFNYEENFRFEHINPNHNDLGKMVLNPDVTVRARGVMEKCTFCVQRVQAAKLDAKRNSDRVDDSKMHTACSQACPTDAIVFGDINDPNSRVTNAFKDERGYGLIEEINTLPSVNYLTKIRNKTEIA